MPPSSSSLPSPSMLLAPLLAAALPRALLAQEPSEIHPWQTGCLDYGCFVGYYCNPDNGLCELCPSGDGDGAVVEGDCLDLGLLSAAPNSTRVESCLVECVRAQVGEACSEDTTCQEGRSFCNFQEAAIEDENTASSSSICRECKNEVSECLFDDTIASEFGTEDCILCDLRVCVPLHFSVTRVEGEENTTIPSNAMQGSPSLFASGPLVDCTNLVHDGETTCNDDNADVRGKICLVDDYTKNTLYIGVVHKCTELGGVGAIFYGDYSPRTPNDQPWTGSLSWQQSAIPSVSIPYDDGKRLHEDKLGVVAQVNTSDVGDACIKQQFCSDAIPCVGNSAGRYCDYKWSYGEEGFCQDCPVDGEGNPSPLSCFFSIEDWGEVTGQKAVEDCAKVCASSLTFPECKFCPQEITGFAMGIENDAERCEFCSENDVLYPDREFPLFGEGIKCWQVQKFFKTIDVKQDSANCQLAQMYNYVCGCSGSGYAGASTETKQKVLAWLPRIMAILSLLSSSFIIYDASKSKRNREKVQNQLLIGLSAFDVFGSIAYAFTTLPIPEDYAYGPIFGAEGTDATCAAQGFFIQIGTISAYMNVSLSIYYLLVIKQGWSENRVKKIRWYLFMAPFLVGFAFALAGIPFYGPLTLWCNNTASYWPEVPVCCSIAIATIVMGTVCWDVYSKEKATKKYHSGRAGRTNLSTKVFWQSFYYLMAFYLTWPAYLALQYAWAGGGAFTRYGFILASGTMVPLQGFWNMLIYIRPRYFPKAATAIRSTVTTLKSSVLTQRSARRMAGGRHSSNKRSKEAMDVVNEGFEAQETGGSASDGKESSAG